MKIFNKNNSLIVNLGKENLGQRIVEEIVFCVQILFENIQKSAVILFLDILIECLAL